MKTRRALVALAPLVLAMTAMASGTHTGDHNDDAIGKPGEASRVSRTIVMNMTDTMRFSVPKVFARQGETIRFVVKNSGKVRHEMVLGTTQELKEHYEVMKKNPEMEHADANMVTVAPGKTGEIIWQFNKAGKVDFACLQPGHYDAGMKGFVAVAGGASSAKQGGHDDHKH